MPNPVKKFEIEIGVIGVWFTPIDEHGKPEEFSRYFSNQELENDINWLTAQLQIAFNF